MPKALAFCWRKCLREIYLMQDRGRSRLTCWGGFTGARWDTVEAYEIFGRQNALIMPMRRRLERP
jgi:hypothetical protein